jgi:aminopeptidase N
VTTPADWVAVSNSRVSNVIKNEEAKTATHFFETTPPISTYLFAFIAGEYYKFSVCPSVDVLLLFVLQLVCSASSC